MTTTRLGILLLFVLCSAQALALSLLEYPPNEPFNYEGRIDSGQTFERPSGCGSASGSTVSYHVQSFQATEFGFAEVRSYQENFDGVIALYEGNFDPNDPLANCIGYNDDDQDLRTSFFGVEINPDVDYFLVTAGYSGTDNGSFKNSIVGNTDFFSPGSFQFSGNTDTGNRFIRPTFDCALATNTSTSYRAQPFSVNVSGDYVIEQDQDFDGAIFVYEGDFNATRPLDGCLAANDDGLGIGNSLLDPVTLVAGRSYVLVSTAFSESGLGNTTTEISGPGLTTLGAGELEPGALTGLWFDPSFDGSGFNIIDSGGAMVVTYYGYYQGEPVWLISSPFTENIVLGQYIQLDLSIGESGELNAPQPPSTLGFFGSVILRFIDCQTAAVEIQGPFFPEDFQSFNLTRLLGSAGPDCR